MDNITIDIYNKNAAKYADLDIDKVSLKAYRQFSRALPKNGIVLDYGCGTGGSIRKVSEFNPKKITGIEERIRDEIWQYWGNNEWKSWNGSI